MKPKYNDSNKAELKLQTSSKKRSLSVYYCPHVQLCILRPNSNPQQNVRDRTKTFAIETEHPNGECSKTPPRIVWTARYLFSGPPAAAQNNPSFVLYHVLGRIPEYVTPCRPAELIRFVFEKVSP